jgi:hypothetical protein|tara:strand:- start:26465 stop:26665 length:201 start_codon:yes stop_codon:yes gene_type:complete
MNKQLSKNKYYKQAYNNPGQYYFNELVTKLETEEDQKTVTMLLNLSIGVKDAKKDKQNGTYKFITN